MRQMVGCLLVIVTLSMLTGCSRDREAGPLRIVEHGASSYTIVCDLASAPAVFAAQELTDIVKGCTGVELRRVDSGSAAADSCRGRRILIGRNPVVEGAVGSAILASLGSQEALVTSRDGDLILVGGDAWGTLYAVYEFAEHELGYRCFLPAPGGELLPRTDTVVVSGATRRQPMAFRGYRDGYPKWWPGFDPQAAARFFVRNRLNQTKWHKSGFMHGSGLTETFHFENHNHGFEFIGWKETFAKHPEYFTLDKHGVRISTAQLCLSNAECRRHVTAKVLERIEKGRANGINAYVVASNDWSGSRYCWCDDCVRLEKTYDSVGGPLWAYMLELCRDVKATYPDVFISTLAYKGPQQTEQAPDGIIFPDNFIADCAFLNHPLTLAETPPETLPGGEDFRKLDNLRQWGLIAKHVSYWLYALGGPIAIYERPQKELAELHAAGVESIFHCGFGGDQQFGDIARYVTLRLMIDPGQDARRLAAEAADFLYGAAAPQMMRHIEELEKLRLTPGLRILEGNPYSCFGFLEPADLIRWRGEFDAMEELTRNDRRRNLLVRQARTAVDLWTLIYRWKIQERMPGAVVDVDAVAGKGLATCDELEAAGLGSNLRSLKQQLRNMKLFAYLKDDTLPMELRGYDRSLVKRYLPAAHGATQIPVSDPEAIAAHAMQATLPATWHADATVGFELWDAADQAWLGAGKMASIPIAEIVPNRYKLYRVGTVRLPRMLRFVVGKLWGSELDIDSLGCFYDPTYHNRNYEFWISLKFDGPAFDPKSTAAASHISWDQILLVDKGVQE